jgi:hypothetical protein
MVRVFAFGKLAAVVAACESYVLCQVCWVVLPGAACLLWLANSKVHGCTLTWAHGVVSEWASSDELSEVFYEFSGQGDREAVHTLIIFDVVSGV